MQPGKGGGQDVPAAVFEVSLPAGVEEVLKVYAGFEQELNQIEFYLSINEPRPVFGATNSTG